MYDNEKDAGPPAFEPFDIEVEQGLLATILARPGCFPIIAAELVPEDFYDPLHARIFEKMLVLDELERPIGPVTLHAVMKNDPGIVALKEARAEVEFDPQDYLRLLANSDLVTKDANLAEYCRIITSHKARRDSYDALADAQQRLDRGDRVDTSLVKIIEVSDRVALRELERGGSPDLMEGFHRLNQEIDNSGTRGRGLMTGWPKFDKQMGGFQPDSFTVIAGRPGMGKSILGTNLLNIAGQILDFHGQRVYDPTGFSLEMSMGENVARIIAEIDFRRCMERGLTDAIHYSDIRKNRLTDAQLQRYIAIGGELEALGIQIFDPGKMTMQRIRALARARAQLSKRQPFILIDHLQIVEGAKHHRGNRLEALTEITGLCKALAKQLSCPVVGLSQLSRGVEARDDKRPVLSDLRESGSIEQDADAVLMIYRPEYYLRQKLRHAHATKAKNAAEILKELEDSKGRLDVDVAKNRHGGVGDVRLNIDVASGAIWEEKPSEQDEAAAGLLDGLGLSDLQKRTGSA